MTDDGNPLLCLREKDQGKRGVKKTHKTNRGPNKVTSSNDLLARKQHQKTNVNIKENREKSSRRRPNFFGTLHDLKRGGLNPVKDNAQPARGGSHPKPDGRARGRGGKEKKGKGTHAQTRLTGRPGGNLEKSLRGKSWGPPQPDTRKRERTNQTS